MAAPTQYTPLQQRQMVAIMGAVIADAAALPLHWIYNAETLKSLTEGVEEIEFRDPPENPFFKVQPGRSSAYGETIMAMLKSLVACKGLSTKHLTQELYQTFGPESEYGDIELDAQRKTPINRLWRNGVMGEFVKNVMEKKTETGSPTDDQVDCVILIIPLVALYAGQPDMLDKVVDAVRVINTGQVAIAYAMLSARVLEQFILHQDPKDVIQTVINDINSPKNPKPHELDMSVVEELQKVLNLKSKANSDVVPAQFRKD